MEHPRYIPQPYKAHEYPGYTPTLPLCKPESFNENTTEFLAIHYTTKKIEDIESIIYGRITTKKKIQNTKNTWRLDTAS